MPNKQLIALFQCKFIAVDNIVGGVRRQIEIVENVGAGDTVDDFG